MLALPFLAAFVLLVFVLIVAPPGSVHAATLESFPPPLPLDELPPTGPATTELLGCDVPVLVLVAAVAVALLVAAVLVPVARWDIRAERAKKAEKP